MKCASGSAQSRKPGPLSYVFFRVRVRVKKNQSGSETTLNIQCCTQERGGRGSGCSTPPSHLLLNTASGLHISVLYVIQYNHPGKHTSVPTCKARVDISARPRAVSRESFPDLSDSRACAAYPTLPAARRAVCRPLLTSYFSSPPTSPHSSLVCT